MLLSWHVFRMAFVKSDLVMVPDETSSQCRRICSSSDSLAGAETYVERVLIYGVCSNVCLTDCLDS